MATEALGTKTADVYRGFIEAVNRHDLEAAARLLDAQRYRENCVGFTHGRVDWEEAKASIRQVWKGLPDLRVELHNVLATGDVAVARGTVRGTATGAAYMARRRLSVLSKRASSTTSGSRTASSSSGAAGGRAGQMRQLYGRAMGLVGLGAMLWRLYGRYETVDVKSPPSSADSANTRSAQILHRGSAAGFRVTPSGGRTSSSAMYHSDQSAFFTAPSRFPRTPSCARTVAADQ